jgi:G:T-mismatch repair DNA endonuclease (very short patch repair protein)
MRGILLDSQRIPWDKLINKYGITKSQYMNILKKHGVQNYVHKEQDFSIQTNPEKEVEGILLDLNISYLRERYIKHKTFRCDFIVDSQIIVEVQGDYWHGNHRLFNKEDLNNIQKDKIERDKKKFEFAYEKGYTVIEIWEMDIYNKYKLVYNALKQILKEREINGTKHFSSEFF